MSRTSAYISALSNSALRSRYGHLFGRPRGAAKSAMGLYFDLFQRSYRTAGFTFEIPRQHTSRALRGKFVAGTYELAERTMIARHLPADACVLELGGSLGIVSCHINRRLANPAAHVVFEPNPNLTATLRTNRDQNRCKFQIESAVLGTGEPVYLEIAENSDSGHIAADDVVQNGVAVRSMTWAETEAKYGLQFDTLVADIEGAEYELILANAGKIAGLKRIIMEMHPRRLGAQKHAEIEAQLRAAGFRLIDEMLDTQVWVKA
jgi:FkbM family methyltransferase